MIKHNKNNQIFSEDQIAAEIADMSESQKNKTIVSLDLEEAVDPAVIAAFAALAKTMGARVSSLYQSLVITRPRPAAQLRESALSTLQWKYEQGKITADLLDGDGGPWGRESETA